ncbi:MAG: cyclase [Oscillatoria princeps RMCB-10]|nr:cyclase [Oscillatoria princeps RMCB-10]
MTELTPSSSADSAAGLDWNQAEQAALLRGEILLKTQSHTLWGGAVTASMYLPLTRAGAWQQLTDYPRWVHYFPDVTRSEVLGFSQGAKRLYQAATKAFLFLSVQVEIYLKVVETLHRHIQFRLEKGSFVDFAADLKLQDCRTGTALTYSVRATPTIPVPAMFIEQAMIMELPANMRQMRQILCRY